MHKKTILLRNLGLGDAFICNGLARVLAKRYGGLVVPSTEIHKPTLEWMFGDDPSIEIVTINNYGPGEGIIEYHYDQLLDLSKYNVIKTGYANNCPLEGNETIDQWYYRQAGVPFECKWSEFKARKCPTQVEYPKEPYFFVHQDGSRGLLVDCFNPNGRRIVYNTSVFSANLFELEDLLVNAEELHLIESSIANWVEHMQQIKNKPLFLYDAKKNYGTPGFPAYIRSDWTIIKEKLPFTKAFEGMYTHISNSNNIHSSGSGSAVESTKEYREFLASVIKRHNIKSILDVGCGYWEFMEQVDLKGVRYKGIDVVPKVIEYNRSLRPDLTFKLQALHEVIELKLYDLVILKDVLQHMPNEVVLDTLQLLKSAKRVLLTNDISKNGENPSTYLGGWRPMDLRTPPYSLPVFEELIYASSPYAKHILLTQLYDWEAAVNTKELIVFDHKGQFNSEAGRQLMNDFKSVPKNWDVVFFDYHFTSKPKYSPINEKFSTTYRYPDSAEGFILHKDMMDKMKSKTLKELVESKQVMVYFYKPSKTD